MNKVVSVSINNTVFSVEENAYSKLKEYLDSINKYFSGKNDGQEIIKDIESSIAEKFTEKLTNKKQTVITLIEVDGLVTEMGKVEDFADEKNEQQPNDSENKTENKDPGVQKRIYRDLDNAIAGGVCSGLAKYLGVDVVFVRIGFFVLTLINGVGLLIYLIMWLIVPAANTPAQKLEMQGQAVTLDKIKNFANEKAKEIQDAKVGNRVAKVFRVIFQALLILIGFGIFVGLVAAIIGLTVAGVGFLVSTGDPSSMPFKIAQHIPFVPYTILILSIYFLVIIPLTLLLLLAISLIRRKMTVNGKIAGILAAIWFLAVIASSAVGFSYQSNINDFANNSFSAGDNDMTVGEGKSEYFYKDFNKIDADGNIIINISKGDEYKIESNGREIDLKRLLVRDDTGTLVVRTNNGFCFGWCGWNNRVEMNIVMPELIDINSNGAVKISVDGFENFVQNANLKIDSDGASNVEIKNANWMEIVVDANGAAKVNLQGKTNILRAEIDGAAKIYALDLEAKQADLDLNGAAKAEVNVLEKLDVKGDGAGRVYYKGNPSVNQDLDGAAKVEKIN